MSTPSVPVYFEESWAILSSIGLVNVLFGLTIIGITSLSPLSLVPIVVSVFGAIANGLCYYAFYADYSKKPTVVAAAVADIAWLIQEAGLSFYSYLILVKVLKHRDRLVFKSLFWSIMLILLVLRIFILASRARDIVGDSTHYQALIDHLHIGYFSSIALVECISAFFLLQKFALARRTSMEAASKSGLFSYLIRSTEIRLASLAVIGITRAITYSFQETAQAATSVASQVDRFVYTLECMFPIMMFIDILASKLVITNHIHDSQSRSSAFRSNRTKQQQRAGAEAGIGLYSISHVETRINGQGEVSSSQERIVNPARSRADTLDDQGRDGSIVRTEATGISKTVEFELHVAEV